MNGKHIDISHSKLWATGFAEDGRLKGMARKIALQVSLSAIEIRSAKTVGAIKKLISIKMAN